MTAQVAYLVLTYLVAAIPFGVVLTTLYGDDVDIRAAGSGNIGATNVARLYGWPLAARVVALDIGKGLVPVAAARLLWPDLGLWWPGLVALTAFGAHCFSVYLEFRGGKGVATGAGGLLAITPYATLGAAALWVTVVAVTGRSSIAALTSALGVLGLAWWLDPAALPVVALVGLGIAATHTANIRRIWRGEESQVIRPVRWGRGAATGGPPSAEQLLEQGPSGAALPPSLWKERVADPLEPTEEVAQDLLAEPPP